MKNYDPKIFTTFESECRQQFDPKLYIEFSGGHDKGDRAGFGCELTNPVAPHGKGDFYCGAWLKGFRHGSGICFYADGSVYKGGWSEGQWGGSGPTGLGMLKTTSGEMIIGWFTGEHGHLKDLQTA